MIICELMRCILLITKIKVQWTRVSSIKELVFFYYPEIRFRIFASLMFPFNFSAKFKLRFNSGMHFMLRYAPKILCHYKTKEE